MHTVTTTSVAMRLVSAVIIVLTLLAAGPAATCIAGGGLAESSSQPDGYGECEGYLFAYGRLNGGIGVKLSKPIPDSGAESDYMAAGRIPVMVIEKVYGKDVLKGSPPETFKSGDVSGLRLDGTDGASYMVAPYRDSEGRVFAFFIYRQER